jgi:hypothetical protein
VLLKGLRLTQGGVKAGAPTNFRAFTANEKMVYCNYCKADVEVEVDDAGGYS